MVPEGASWALAWGANRDLYFSTAGFQEVVHVDAAAATPSKVMAVDSLRGEVAVYPYQMLPGGKYLLAGVTRGSPERDDLVAIDVKTGVSTDLLPDAGWIAYYAPSGHLVYVTQQNGPLYVRPFDAARLEITGPVAEARPKVNDQAWAFSASGRFANVVWSEPREHLLRVSFDRNVGVLPVDTMDLQRLRVSPSGRYVAFAASPTGESGWSMSVYDDASSSQLELTYEGVDFGDPAWSPDEKRLAYSMKEETTNRIYVSPSDGSGSPELLVRTAAHSRSPDWSPDGKHIVFETEGNLWLYSFADSTARPLPERLNERGVQLQPRFSPDGRYLTYLSNETGDYELFVALVDGTAKWRITSDGAYAPAWSADQRRIFFLRGSAIAEVRIETAPAFRILGERIAYSSDRELNWFDPMPDDRGFVVAELVEAPTSHFEIVDNWFEYLEEIAPHPD
jgi:dipeptidyl aminopeptidase/acylaminoacyl peptidase